VACGTALNQSLRGGWVEYVFNTEVRHACPISSSAFRRSMLLAHTGAPAANIYAVYSNWLFLIVCRIICVFLSTGIKSRNFPNCSISSFCQLGNSKTLIEARRASWKCGVAYEGSNVSKAETVHMRIYKSMLTR
jgi:hypothetical protein